MSTVDQVLDAARDLVTQALSGLQTSPPSFYAYKGWPQPEELASDLANKVVHVSVYSDDLGERETTIGIDRAEQSKAPVVNLSAQLSAIKLQGGDAVTPAAGTITFAGTVDPGVIMLVSVNGKSASYSPATGAYLADVATGLAAAINADATLSGVVVASASAAVVTLTALTPGVDGNAITFGLKIGGTGEVTRRTRQQAARIEIHVWAYDDASRALYANTIDDAFAEAHFLMPADGIPSRLTYRSTIQTDAEIKHGVYRRVLHYTVDYSRTRVADAVQVLEGLTTVSAT